MNMSYKEAFNDLAYSQIPKRIKVPDFRLCIGDAERLDSIPVLLFTDIVAPAQKVKKEDVSKMPIEKIGVVGDGNYIDDSDFDSNNFFDAIHMMGGV